jgi:two-component system response regulator AtoC
VYAGGSEFLAGLVHGPLPDVALLDVLMPGLSGLDTLKALRTAHPALPIIMLSGSQTPSTIVDAVRHGAVDYVVKPSDPDGLDEAALEVSVRNALEKLTLANEVSSLRAKVATPPDGAEPWRGAGASMHHVITVIERVADSDVTILITGESGVGKEVVARELHRRSGRRTRNFVKVNCAALPAELLESELYGHERGAFTGAQQLRIGRFEFANHGTILLDEIGEMPARLQAKLLHVLQDRSFTRLGSHRQVPLDVRVMAATNRELEQLIAAGQFREDLYYRLQVIQIRVPPLRERRDEIPLLAEFFLETYGQRYGRSVSAPSARLQDAFLSYPWPGNVRELENVIRRFVILKDEELVLNELARDPSGEMRPSADHAPAESGQPAIHAAEPAPMPPVPMAGDALDVTLASGSLLALTKRAVLSAERRAIQQTLDRFHWNRRKTAELLGVSYKTLLNKMKECGISAPEAAGG